MQTKIQVHLNHPLSIKGKNIGPYQEIVQKESHRILGKDAVDQATITYLCGCGCVCIFMPSFAYVYRSFRLIWLENRIHWHLSTALNTVKRMNNSGITCTSEMLEHSYRSPWRVKI